MLTPDIRINMSNLHLTSWLILDYWRTCYCFLTISILISGATLLPSPPVLFRGQPLNQPRMSSPLETSSPLCRETQCASTLTTRTSSSRPATRRRGKRNALTCRNGLHKTISSWTAASQQRSSAETTGKDDTMLRPLLNWHCYLE